MGKGRSLDGAEKIRGFMDRVDWDYELGEACGGSRVYPSVNDLRENETCVDQWGIVEVEVSLVRVVEPGEVVDGGRPHD